MLDNPAFEYAKSTVSAPEVFPPCPDADQCPHVKAARTASQSSRDKVEAFREIVFTIFEAAAGNPNRAICLQYRIFGLSLRDIGAQVGMSQEGVRKHLNECLKRMPSLAPILGRVAGQWTGVAASERGSEAMRRMYEARVSHIAIPETDSKVIAEGMQVPAGGERLDTIEADAHRRIQDARHTDDA